MRDTPRSVQLIRDAIAATESVVVLEQLRTLAREQYTGPERADLERLIDRRAAAIAEQLPREVGDESGDRDAG